MGNKKTYETEVLFQKLGDQWYVFSEVEDDVIYSALPYGVDPRTTKMDLIEIIEEHLQKISQNSTPVAPRRRTPDLVA